MKRLFDMVAAAGALCILLVPMLVIALAIKCDDRGPAIYWSSRVGRNNQLFKMPKFRTMRQDTPAVATHLLGDASRYLTSVGATLRKWSLDEVPQLWSVLRGDMSFIGPRPALFNQRDLIDARTRVGVHLLVPGLTGLAQVSGRDELSIAEKVQKDFEYLRTQSMALDLRILWLTVIKVARREGVVH